MKILFFFVHPSKFYLFRHTIHYLQTNGHRVDVAIITKDVLETLVQQEGWKYKNIARQGRRKERMPSIAKTVLQALHTSRKLMRMTKKASYDLFVTDDLLVVPGKIRKVPTLYFQDTDVEVVPESSVLLELATHAVSPQYTELGRYNMKKISYAGYHELAYLHPDYFQPDRAVVDKFHDPEIPYSIIRLVSLTATHDRHKRGLSNEQVQRLINLLERHGKVYISAERRLPKRFEHYRLPIEPSNIHHALAFAELLVCDSQTMTTEAAILGTPAIRCNDFVGRIRSMERLEHEYDLTYGYSPDHFEDMIQRLESLLNLSDRKQLWLERRERLLNDTEDVNRFIIKTIEKFQDSPNVRHSAVVQSCTHRSA